MKILQITPNFFNYPKIICDELKRMGHEIDWYDDRPSTSSIMKAIIRIYKKFVNKIIDRYSNNILEEIKDKKYDKIFIISGQSFSFNESMMKRLKESQKSAEFILYQWDSLKNFPYIKTMHSYFDRIFSFDKDDVAENPGLEFLPLFFSRQYEELGKEKKKDYQYDFSFIGTAHPKKYKYVKKISNVLREKFDKQYIFFYFPSKLVYIYRKIKNIEFQNAKYCEFNFKALSSSEIITIIENSKCILDSAQDGQRGLTIRVIEMLGAKRKIITTNEDVVNYDFYRPENIYVYNEGFDFESVFFKEEYVDVEKEVYEKYTLRNWLKKVLND